MATVSTLSAPRVRFKDPQIEMAHGAGGKASRRLVEGLIAPLLLQPGRELPDAAHVAIGAARLAITTDSFVVRPLRFPGGSIGELAVNGTVNDLAVSGARAEYMVVTFVLEAGLPSDALEAELRAMSDAARRAGVVIVGGDTKVVEHGQADRMYVTTTGIGRPLAGVEIDARSVRAGDRVLVSGPVGDHGVVIQEDDVPVHDGVRGACELLGLDPLHIANEGQFLAVVAPEQAARALEAVRAVPGGEQARLIGEIRAQPGGTVLAMTRYGASRVVDMLVGDPLPRIC